jgi:hypothetical protein
MLFLSLLDLNIQLVVGIFLNFVMKETEILFEMTL